MELYILQAYFCSMTLHFQMRSSEDSLGLPVGLDHMLRIILEGLQLFLKNKPNSLSLVRIFLNLQQHLAVLTNLFWKLLLTSLSTIYLIFFCLFFNYPCWNQGQLTNVLETFHLLSVRSWWVVMSDFVAPCVDVWGGQEIASLCLRKTGEAARGGTNVALLLAEQLETWLRSMITDYSCDCLSSLGTGAPVHCGLSWTDRAFINLSYHLERSDYMIFFIGKQSPQEESTELRMPQYLIPNAPVIQVTCPSLRRQEGKNPGMLLYLSPPPHRTKHQGWAISISS